MQQTSISRPFGLSRRQSYDPLSTTKAQSLSLGTLPPPHFGPLPGGQRSVPAVESNRFLGAGFRGGPHGDGQRTPGGSLVVGSEVFGFGGRPPAKDARERWGSGAVGGQEEDEDDGSNEATPNGLEDPAGQSRQQPASDWPSEFEKGVSGAGAQSEFQLKPGQSARTKHSLESLSAVSSFLRAQKTQSRCSASFFFAAWLRDPSSPSSVPSLPS